MLANQKFSKYFEINQKIFWLRVVPTNHRGWPKFISNKLIRAALCNWIWIEVEEDDSLWKRFHINEIWSRTTQLKCMSMHVVVLCRERTDGRTNEWRERERGSSVSKKNIDSKKSLHEPRTDICSLLSLYNMCTFGRFSSILLLYPTELQVYNILYVIW